MPSVGRKRFPYTSAGQAEAKRYARKTGKPIRNTSGNRSGLENRGGSRMMRNPGMAPRPRRMSGLSNPRRAGGGLRRRRPSMGRPARPMNRNRRRGY